MNHSLHTDLRVYFFACLLILTSCKHHKQIQQVRVENKPIVTPKTDFSLLDSVKQHAFTYKTLSAKIKTTYKAPDGSELELAITLRSVYDSAIWMSISPALGIEAVRVLLTPDTVKVIDKLNRHYAIEPYSYLKRFSEADITFGTIQNIISGNAAFINDSFRTDSITNYYFGNCRQRSLTHEMAITKAFRIFASVIADTLSSEMISIKNSDFTFVEYEYFPFDIRIEAFSKNKTSSITLNYSNVAINIPVELKFSIPHTYTKFEKE